MRLIGDKMALFGFGGLNGLLLEFTTPDKINPMTIFATSGVLAAAAGIAELLNSERPFNTRNALGSLLNSGLLGIGVAMGWYHWFLSKGLVFALMATCLFVGFGGLPIATQARRLIGAWFGRWFLPPTPPPPTTENKDAK
jgi:hypothetical protein